MNTAKLFTAILLALVLGCSGKRESEPEIADTIGGMTATEYLQSVFSRYRNAESYRDSAVVKFTFQSGGRTEQVQAPLSVWFERDRLYVEAYDARLHSDTETITAWIKDPSTRDFDSQVVRVAADRGRPRISDLFADTVLNDRIAAGLAGPPPQLEWLLAAEPMSGLFEGEHEIAFEQPREIDEKPCQIVRVIADGDRYRFWIDQRSSLIRRVDLPPILVPIELLAQSSGESVGLSLELNDATFQAAVEQPELAELPRRPKYVGHFIPLPPEEPSSRLGTEPSSFTTRDQSGRVSLSNSGSDRELTVLLFIDSQSSDSQSSAMSLAHWASMMPSGTQQRVRVAVITDEQGFRRLPRDFPLAVYLDDDQAIRTAYGVRPRDLVVVNRQGRIDWVHRVAAAESLSLLGPIIGDILNGVNVPLRVREQYRTDAATYKSVLAAEVDRASALSQTRP